MLKITPFFTVTSCVVILFACVLIISCSNHNKSSIVKLGAQNGKYTFVYLGGLTDSFYSQEEMKHRSILDKIGKELELTFLVPMPKNRCPQFSEKLCWPHNDEFRVISTYQEIISDLGMSQIDGWIGFSNGGYFLQELLHYRSLEQPIITIGAAGRIEHNIPIKVMIGLDDVYAYNRVKELGYNFIEYKGGHEVDYESLRGLIIDFLQNSTPRRQT